MSLRVSVTRGENTGARRRCRYNDFLAVSAKFALCSAWT